VSLLSTPRLLLRPLAEADLEAFAEICAEPAVMRFIGARRPSTRDECAEVLARVTAQWEQQGYGQWAVVERDTGLLVGWVGFRAQPIGPEPELGWALRSSRWGRGLATEAVRAVIRHAAFPTITCVIDPTNVASVRLAERVGFVWRASADGQDVYQRIAIEPRLRTPRLVLEPLRASHADALWPIVSDATRRFVIAPKSRTPEELRERWRAREGDEERLAWAVLLGDACIGKIDANVSADRVATNVGYVFAAAHEGHGYATEAVGAVVEHLLRAGVRALHARVDPENIRSVRVLERLGFARGEVDGADVRYVRLP
jgi:RimJ/RimL family protein N-acetyltransferase